MDSSFKLEIITPSKIYMKDDVEQMSVTTSTGEITILPHHADMIADVVICPLRLRINSHELIYAISGGTLNISQKENLVFLYVYAIESHEEIDIDRAELAKEKAQELLSNADSARMMNRAEIKMKRALNRIKVKNLTQIG